MFPTQPFVFLCQEIRCKKCSLSCYGECIKSSVLKTRGLWTLHNIKCNYETLKCMMYLHYKTKNYNHWKIVFVSLFVYYLYIIILAVGTVVAIKRILKVGDAASSTPLNPRSLDTSDEFQTESDTRIHLVGTIQHHTTRGQPRLNSSVLLWLLQQLPVCVVHKAHAQVARGQVLLLT